MDNLVKGKFAFIKNKKIILLLLSVIFVIACIIVTSSPPFQRYYNYNLALDDISKSDWNSAKLKLEHTSNYKDSNELLAYVNAKLILNGSDPKDKDINDLQKIQQLLATISADYNGELSYEINSFKNEINIALKDKQEKQHIVDLISNGKYSDATVELVNLKDENDEYRTLYYYASALESLDNGDKEMFIYYLCLIPQNYTGVMYDKIQSVLQMYSSEIENKKPYIRNPDAPKPQIGMTADEVLNSSWGKPQHVNKTITANGVSEQWVYGMGRYVYLENGIVTAIQE